jgi:hypothetical protein
MPIACALGRTVSTSSRYVEDTVAKSAAAAMKRDGGKPPDLTQPSGCARCGWTRIRWQSDELDDFLACLKSAFFMAD